MGQQFVTFSGTAAAPRLREVDVVVAPGEPGFIYSRRISWASIFAGAAVGATVQLILTLLGAGIGLLAIGHYADRGASDTALGIWAGLYMLLTALVSLFLGGAVAARGARVTPCLDGVIHGLVVWSLVTLLSVSVLGTSAAALMGGLMTGLTRFMPVAVEAASSTTGGVTRHNPGAADSALTPGGTVGGENGIGRTEADLRTRQGAAADGTFVGGPNGIGRDTPGRNADEPQTREAARDLGKAAIFSFFGLLLGAVAASLGGSIGRHMFQRYDATGAVPVPANAAATG